ncbi:hypothetical protein SESBI_03604 [Sesbania bispinosa]|nr:hypothetical protein SESBI_03604 [Sesbania bispinosa]
MVASRAPQSAHVLPCYKLFVLLSSYSRRRTWKSPLSSCKDGGLNGEDEGCVRPMASSCIIVAGRVTSHLQATMVMRKLRFNGEDGCKA